MKYAITLAVALFANWLLWSGHFDNAFLIGLGIASCLASIALSLRMHIVDEEGAPAQLGIRPFVSFAPWLAKEIVVSNLEVARTILSPNMRLNRNLVRVNASQKTSLGRVIFSNSITLTPGTVSVALSDDQILVHGLSLEETAEDVAGEMNRRVCDLEQTR